MCKQAYLVLAVMLAVCWPLAAEQLSDPTRPLDYRQTEVNKPPPLELNSILIGKGRRIAVINGQRAAEREQIGDVLVLRILPNSVIVRRDGEQIELKLHSTPTRSNAS